MQHDPHIQAWGNSTQQQPNGLRRFLTTVGVWKSAGIFGGVAILVLGIGQAVMPASLRPGYIIGGFFGGIIGGEQDAARPATVRTTQQIADAQAMAQARMQEQVLAAQNAQQLTVMTATPSIIGSWFAQAMCAFGIANDDARYRKGCGVAQSLNANINSQPGAAMDNLGTVTAWPGAPQGAGAIPAGADAAPLTQVDYSRMARYENMLSPGEVARARATVPDRTTNRGERHYLAVLADLVGEGGADSGPTTPGVLRQPQLVPAGQYEPHAVPGFNQR